jgi:YVTN family beta-propeller protein
MLRSRAFATLALLILPFIASADDAAPQAKHSPRKLPGMQAGGRVLLPTQWSLQPAGKQLRLGDFPVNIAMHPSEAFAAVLHAGYGEHEIQVVDLKSFRVVSSVSLPETFYGLHFAPKGNYLYASGASYELIHRFRFEKGYLLEPARLYLGEEKRDKLIPAGISSTADGATLFVACAWGHKLAILPWDGSKREFIDLEADSYPYASLLSADGLRLYVSLWGGSGVAVLNLESKKVEAEWPTPSHPTEMALSPDGSLLYVACANSTSVAEIDVQRGKTLEVLHTALYPQADNGSTPNSLSLSPDGKVLLVANADNNNVAVIDVSTRGRSRSLGFIPVGWYPTSVRFSKADGKIYVANGKGLMPKANRQGPNPLNNPPRNLQEYIGGLYQGTLSQIEPPSPADMAKYTKTAFSCSPLREDKQPVAKPREANNPIPASVPATQARSASEGQAPTRSASEALTQARSASEGSSPIKHCIYIVKENRTYDQILGDMPQGNGDPNLCIFPERVTPNHHALARQFVLLDNFYVESEVSADGHEWSMAAYATDFVEKTWPLVYRGSREGKLKYPSEGNLAIAEPSSGYIWDRCKEAGVTYRSYGEFIANPAVPGQPATAKVKSLEGHFDPFYHGYDLDYSDQKRADRFIEEIKRFEREGQMPRFIVLRLPNDHTYGTSPGKPTPTAMVADNDLALGRMIEAISHSKFWKETAVFVVEDDAQNGSDHVDAHRTVAYVISPYTKRGFVDSSMYSTASMLRTMELILGLQPMTQFDAAALPMYNSFTAKADLSGYKHLPVTVDLNEKNLASAWGAEMSLAFDFSKEDAADDLLLNEVVWRSVRGADSPMPPPVRAGFVFAAPEDEDEAEEEERKEQKQ